MKITFNPSTVAALTTPPNNKDITFDLRGRNIFARGVKFYGTDTNTWRDIKINNVSIGSHTLDLRNGSNTTLTNTNGVVTINSTWRPVVDNLTSDSTTSSLSAKQGKVLKALIDGKSNSDHNHDGRYVRYYAVTTLDCNNLAAGLTSARISATNAAHTNHSAYLYISDVGTPFQIQIPDSSIPYIYKRYYGSGKWSGWFKLNAGYADSAGSVAWANVTGKPSSYTPSAHTHAWNSLTHSSTTENQAILTNGKANGWKLQTLNIARWDNAANNAHSHANKSVLDGITSALVNSWNTAYNFVSNITGTDTDKVINKWEEIVNFLAGITEDNKLNTLLNSKLSVYELADNTNVGTIKNNGIYYSTTDASSKTLINSPFNTGFAFINMTSYDGGDDLRRSRLAFNAFGEIKVSDDRDQANTAETWYNVLTSKNSGINGSTIKLNGTSITVYSSGTADERYVKKSGDTMSGVLTIDTTNFGALTIQRNDDDNGASIQFRGKSSVYGYIGLNNSAKDKQFLRWSSDTYRIYTILDTSSTYISNGKGVINGNTITQVDNATNSTNSTNARKLVNWYSARPTSLNAQFGDGSLRIFYATSSTTEGKPAEDSHILHLAWDNTGGFDAQLAVHARSGKVSTRAQNGGTWQPWKTLAFTTDIPSSLKNPYSFNVFGVVYDGSAAKTVTTSTFVSQLPEYTSTVTDGTMFITSWASNSGFADTNAVNVPYKRKAIHLWEYIKAKTDSLYATKGHTHDDRYYTKAESNAKYITDITTSVNKLTFTRNGSNIIRDITVNVVHSQGYLTNIPNKDATTKASPGLLIYNSYEQTIGTNSYSSVLSINTGGTIQIAGNWGDDHARNLYWRSQSDKNVADYPWKSWRTILDSENYSSTLDSRYYTESEVNSLLDAKLNRQNLSYGNWNPRGYHLAADYHYNGGDLSISESGGKIHVSVNGYFWQNEGQYRVLDTSDVAGLKSNLTVHQFLSATDAAWYPLVWGGNSHNNTSDSTGAVYKSYDKLSWQTSSQTLYATNIQTNNIKNLSIGGGIYWNPYVESASDNTDAASITLVRSGVAGGTTLVLSQMGNTNDTIQFKTNTAARLYHNSYPILTTQNTYVSNNKGYINGLEITQVNNADTLDGAHLSDIKNWSDRTASAYWKAGWYKVASAQTATNTEAFLTLDVNAVQSNGHATLFIRKRADSKPYFICIYNNNLNLADFRLYYNGMSMVLYARVPNDWHGRVFRIISEGREGTYAHIWTLYSNESSTDPNAISAEGGNPYINPTYSGRVDWSNSSDKANYADSAGSVAWNNVTGKPSAFNPAAHTHTVFKNNLMIKGTNGISDSASIHLGIGDSDTGFKWISDGVCQIYANNAAVGQWTSGGMDWFKNPTVNGNKVWNSGNDGSGSGLDSDLVDGLHASRFPIYYNLNMSSISNHWYKLGTARISESDNIMIHIYSGDGWNSDAYQNAYATLMIKTGNNPNGGLTREFGATMVNHHHSNMTYKLISPSNDTVDIWVKIPWGYSSGWYSIHGEYSSYTHSGASQSAEPTGNAQTGVETLTNAYTSSNVASATKLATPRTIWGQSFDGTADVDNTLRIKQTTGNYCEGIRIQTADSTWATIILGATGDSGTNANAWSIHRKADNNFAISRNSSDGTNGLVMTSVGMGLGTTAPTQRLDVAGNIRATGQIIREGHSTTWVYGRSVALLRETSAVGYHTLWSLKTTNGSWDFGEYNVGSDWNNIPVLSYVTDSNYNSGNNATTYQIKFPLASGTVALTSNIPNPTNYYWANVKISASSSTTTSPTFSNVYLGNSLYLNTRGSNSIYNGPNDYASGVGGPLNNLVFSSWYGVSFTTSCAGQTYTNKNAVSINCRTGKLYAGEVQANGFMHTGHNNNDAVLLAGGGYKTLKDFIFLNKSYNYADNGYYNLSFHKLSGICNNLVWVDGHVKGYISKNFVIDPAVFPYRYDDDPDLNTIYLMSGQNYITINAAGVVTINNATDHRQRVGFFYVGRA